MCDIFNLMNVESSIVALEEKDSGLEVQFIGLTNEYVEDYVVENSVKYGVNQPVLYRHVHPTTGKGFITGRITDVKLESIEGGKADGGTLLRALPTAKFHNYNENQTNVIDYVKKKEELGDPIKWSVAFENFKTASDIGMYEWSITDIPVCEECATTNVEQLELEDMINMAKEEVKEEVKELEGDAKLRAEVQELKLALDKTVGKVTSLEKTNADLTTKLEATETKADTEVKEMEDKSKAEIVSMESRIVELEKEIVIGKKVPLISRIYELEQDEVMKARYYTDGWTIEELETRLKERKEVLTKTPQIEVKKFEDSKRTANTTDAQMKLIEQYEKNLKEAGINV